MSIKGRASSNVDEVLAPSSQLPPMVGSLPSWPVNKLIGKWLADFVSQRLLAPEENYILWMVSLGIRLEFYVIEL